MPVLLDALIATAAELCISGSSGNKEKFYAYAVQSGYLILVGAAALGDRSARMPLSELRDHGRDLMLARAATLGIQVEEVTFGDDR